MDDKLFIMHNTQLGYRLSVSCCKSHSLTSPGVTSRAFYIKNLASNLNKCSNVGIISKSTRTKVGLRNLRLSALKIEQHLRLSPLSNYLFRVDLHFIILYHIG